MSKKTIGGTVLSVVVALVGIYFNGHDNMISTLAVGVLAITVFWTCKSIKKDRNKLLYGST
jgi:hypothetical protein